MCTEGESPRWVTGCRRRQAPPKPRGTPGTTCNRHPRLPEKGELLPAPAEEEGSPPFKRTTCRPARAFSNKRRPISSWGTLWWPALCPRPAAPPRAGPLEQGRVDEPVVHHHLRLERASLPRRVRSPGSPGPAPTNVTVPTVTAGPSLLVSQGAGQGLAQASPGLCALNLPVAGAALPVCPHAPEGEGLPLHRGEGPHRGGAPRPPGPGRRPAPPRGSPGCLCCGSLEKPGVKALAGLHPPGFPGRGGEHLLRGEGPADPALQPQAL